MDKLKLQRPWNETKEKLKEVNPELGEEDLQYDEAHPEALIQRLAKRMGRDEDHIRTWIESVSANSSKAS